MRELSKTSGRVPQRNERQQPSNIPRMVYADSAGRIYDHSSWQIVGNSGRVHCRIPIEAFIPLPEGSTLFTMPGRRPVGFDTVSEKFCAGSGQAVSAFIAPGYTRTYLPGAIRDAESTAPVLPLFAYTAIGFIDNQFWVPAVRIDRDERCEPWMYQDDTGLAVKVRRRLSEQPHNRLLQQLARCALEYHCFAAKNTFYRRWELPLPTSPVCNARCLGCISLQPAESCPSSQERIPFVPTPDEIVELAADHLQNAPEPIVSFGQGCEGEPLLQADVLAQAIRKMRQITARGTINLNTNGFCPKRIQQLCQAGLDSVRFTLPSANPNIYQQYIRPIGFSIDSVVAAMAAARSAGLWISLNLLVFPGITDTGREVDALVHLYNQVQFNMIQMRNLNIDPDVYLDHIGTQPGSGIGIPQFIEHLRSRLPMIRFGYFNPLKESFTDQSIRIKAPPRRRQDKIQVRSGSRGSDGRGF